MKAILQCNNLLAMISLARALFHLRGKKAAYWSELTIETRNMLKNWHKSDVKRYSKE